MKRPTVLFFCLLLIFCSVSAQAEDVSPFYEYLRDTLLPQKGLVSGGMIPAKAGKLGSTMVASCSGVISAIVLDFDGDGQLELLTVEGDRSTEKYEDYAWRLALYGETGSLDTKEHVAWLETGTAGGTMTVDVQRSEGKVYIICDANIRNMDSSDWDYHSRRFYTVENRSLVDLTDYESLLHSNSGLSLRDESGRTTLCSVELTWDSIQLLDFTSLAEYAGTPSLAQRYVPLEVNLSSAVPETQDTAATLLMKRIEEVTPLLHISTDTLETGDTAFLYDAENGCRVKITADGFGTVREVWISDGGLYDKNRALKHIDEYLDMDMTEQLKSIFRVVAGEPPVLIGDQKSDQDRIVFRNEGEVTVGGAHVALEKAVYTAASGSVTSSVTITWPEDAAYASEAAAVVAPVSDASGEETAAADASASGEFQSYTAKTAKKGVNVRQQPDQGSKKVTQLGKGEEVTVIGSAEDTKGVTWYQVVTSKGKEGYIRGDLLKRVE